MNADSKMGQGDLLPILEAVLRDGSGQPRDLTNVTSVTFRMRLLDQSRPRITGAAIIYAATAGVVRHAWVAGETEVPGLYLVEWGTVEGGLAETFANDDKSTLWINPRV